MSLPPVICSSGILDYQVRDVTRATTTSPRTGDSSACRDAKPTGRRSRPFGDRSPVAQPRSASICWAAGTGSSPGDTRGVVVRGAGHRHQRRLCQRAGAHLSGTAGEQSPVPPTSWSESRRPPWTSRHLLAAVVPPLASISKSAGQAPRARLPAGGEPSEGPN